MEKLTPKQWNRAVDLATHTQATLPEAVNLVQMEFDLSGPDVSKIVQGVIDGVQKIAIEQVRKRWIEEHLDDPNNWLSIGQALQAWFDEVHATMRTLLGLI